MAGPKKVDETTQFEINIKSLNKNGRFKKSVKKTKESLDYCYRFFLCAFVRICYVIAFFFIYDCFYYENEGWGIVSYFLFGFIIFAEFIHNVRKKDCRDDGFITPTSCLIIGYVNFQVVVLPFLIGFFEGFFEGAINKGLYTPLIPQRHEAHKGYVIAFVLNLIFCKFITPRNSNRSSREVSMLPIIQIGMAMDSFEFFDVDTGIIGEAKHASRLIEIIWALSLIQFIFDPTHTIEVEEDKDENGKPTAYHRFKQFIFDDVSLITAVIFQEIPYLWWRWKYSMYLDSKANMFKNIGVVYFTVRRFFIYVLDEDNSGSITLSDFTEAWKKGGFVKYFIQVVIGIVVALFVFVLVAVVSVMSFFD